MPNSQSWSEGKAEACLVQKILGGQDNPVEEVLMAKRRNLKKEKALRNEEYARKFRKRGQGNRRRRMGGGFKQAGDASGAAAEGEHDSGADES